MLTPDISANYVTHMRSRDAELASNDRAIAVTIGDEPADFSNVGCAQSRMWIGLAPDITSVPMMRGSFLGNRHISPTLGTHVSQIVEMRAEEQVVRSHADTIVAVVENPEAIRDISEVDLPGEAVGVISQPTAITRDAEDAVALAATGCPFPATISFLNLRPEPFLPFHPKEYTSCH